MQILTFTKSPTFFLLVRVRNVLLNTFDHADLLDSLTNSVNVFSELLLLTPSKQSTSFAATVNPRETVFRSDFSCFLFVFFSQSSLKTQTSLISC